MIRFRADITFTATGAQLGLPQWCVNQAAQIAAMAWHLREGQPGEEVSFNLIDPKDPARYRANLFVPSSELSLVVHLFNAIDSQATHIASGRMDIHECGHDADPPSPCQPPTHERRWPL